ncbi:hypothetical protein [Alistipes provencensis]|uniref:hypothetical protein n=1 Tax=Alistipes provencensis TaxID=1816676 RepID=UPI0007EE17D4|nr:hypothetical protein [Alistipes provencensis]
MKKLKILIGTVLLSAGMVGCTSAYYASAGYASDDLYAVHDKTQIARKKQAEAAAAENNYYEYQAADANPYESVLADDYESAYARRLRGFESPSYKMPSSYLNARYSSAFNYASAYDPAFYNIVISGDQVWVEPKYVTSMFGTWGTVVYGDPWYWGWNRPWGPSFSIGSWGWSFGWNSWNNPWYSPWGPWYSSWYDPWYRPGWGWGPGWHGGHHHHPGPGWGPGHGGGHGSYRPSTIVNRPRPYSGSGNSVNTYRRPGSNGGFKTDVYQGGNRGNRRSSSSGVYRPSNTRSDRNTYNPGSSNTGQNSGRRGSSSSSSYSPSYSSPSYSAPSGGGGGSRGGGGGTTGSSSRGR